MLAAIASRFSSEEFSFSTLVRPVELSLGLNSDNFILLAGKFILIYFIFDNLNQALRSGLGASLGPRLLSSAHPLPLYKVL